MSKSDAVAVTISSIGDDRQIRVSEFYTGSERQRSSMQCLASVTIDILADFAGTTDSRKHDHLMFRNVQFFQRILDGGHDEIISAARTPLDFR